MKEKLDFIKLPMLLVAIFFVGKLIVGAAGGSYELGNRLFSMVVLQIHIGLLWAAVGRRYRGYRLGEAVLAVVMIVAFSQSLIVLGTLGSYVAGAQTHFNYPEALNSKTAVEFGPAMMARASGFIGNCILGAVMASLGFAMGRLIPAERGQRG